MEQVTKGQNLLHLYNKPQKGLTSLNKYTIMLFLVLQRPVQLTLLTVKGTSTIPDLNENICLPCVV